MASNCFSDGATPPVNACIDVVTPSHSRESGSVCHSAEVPGRGETLPSPGCVIVEDAVDMVVFVVCSGGAHEPSIARPSTKLMLRIQRPQFAPLVAAVAPMKSRHTPGVVFVVLIMEFGRR